MVKPPLLSPSRHEPALAGRCALGVVVKTPRPGESKTRLTPPLSPEQAADLSRCFFRDTLDNLATASAVDPFGVPVVIYAPAGSEREIAGITPPGTFLLPQRSLTLGERLESATRDLFSVGCAAVVLTGSDSPTVPTAYYRQALAYLRAQPGRVIVGPSDDGGYYLIGLGSFRPSLFYGIDWSTDRVFAQTLANARLGGVHPCLLPTWHDVDDTAGLDQLRRELAEGLKWRPGGIPAPHTARCLARLEAVGVFPRLPNPPAIAGQG